MVLFAIAVRRIRTGGKKLHRNFNEQMSRNKHAHGGLIEDDHVNSPPLLSHLVLQNLEKEQRQVKAINPQKLFIKVGLYSMSYSS